MRFSAGTIGRAYLAQYSGTSRATKIYLFVSFVNAMGQMLTLFLSLFLSDKGMAIHNIGLTITIYGCGSLVGAYLGGFLCDRFNPNRLVAALFFLSCVLLFSLALNIPLLLLVLIIFILGMLANAVRPPIIILLTNGADECERTRILGLRRLVVNLGAGFAASIGGILASINFHWVFISDGIAALVVMVILIVFSKCLGNQNAASSQVEKKDTHKIAQVRKHDIKKFIFLSLLVFAVELVFIQLNVTYPIYLKDIYHLSIRTDQVRILL